MSRSAHPAELESARNVIFDDLRQCFDLPELALVHRVAQGPELFVKRHVSTAISTREQRQVVANEVCGHQEIEVLSLQPFNAAQRLLAAAPRTPARFPT